jgi:hypothetical protein
LVRGQRQSRHQLVPCPDCGRKLFVLPRSPWKSPPPARVWQTWAGPVVAGLLAAGLLTAGFLASWPWVSRLLARPERITAEGIALRDRIEAGQRALAEGRFRLAQKELNAAVAERDRHPQVLSPEEHRQLNQLQRQADLLARLSSHSLEEILQQASFVRDPEEWQARFEDYKGRTIIFDDLVGIDRSGRPALRRYQVHIKGEVARLALEEVALLHDLPLQHPCRLLFGVRLAWCGRGEGGGWVVRFEPDSGVLLTDLAAAQACSPVPLEDLEGLLERQRKWIDQQAGLRPAMP